MNVSMLFVHSPLVGPSSWLAVSDLMARDGFDVSVPDLTGVAQAPPPMWRTVVDTAVEAAGVLAGPLAIVGHSGAGAFLPAIADRVGQGVVSLIFVDAVIPPSDGSHQTSAAMHTLLDEQTDEGHLRRWLEWWPEEVVGDLLPDTDDRLALLADMPSLPRAFYDEAVPVPDGWRRDRCCYLKLSDAYDQEFIQAGDLGWTRVELDADHLAIHTQPSRVAAALRSLLDEPR
ncbi:MAG: alpha/beta fold hydrolase [Euzebya sp.]